MGWGTVFITTKLPGVDFSSSGTEGTPIIWRIDRGHFPRLRCAAHDGAATQRLTQHLGRLTVGSEATEEVSCSCYDVSNPLSHSFF